jgi:hypothetical protein
MQLNKIEIEVTCFSGNKTLILKFRAGRALMD